MFVLAMILRCVATTPFGTPVAPLVYMIIVMSSGPTWIGGSSSEAFSRSPSYESASASDFPVDMYRVISGTDSRIPLTTAPASSE